MKRIRALTAFLVLLALLAGCTPATQGTQSQAPSQSQSSTDTEPPSVRVNPSKVTLKEGEEYDLMKGVSGYDGEDGTITDKIIIDDGGFDSSVAGEYMITYTLTDSSGNTDSATRKITVTPSEIIKAPPVWEGEIAGEISPVDPAVYGGAWYHKVVSSKDKWVGIETTVTLPEFEIERYNGEYDTSLAADPSVKNLDNPSVYLGGNARSESDVGLSLSRVLINAANRTVSVGSVAYRPFWRYITTVEQDVGDYTAHGGKYAVSANGNNCFGNYHWQYTEYYYLPGDKLRIIIYIPEPDKMQLQIEVLEKSSLDSSIALREKYGWKDPADFASPVFHSPGHGTGINAEYKRVNAIDQSANEGKTAIPTETKVTGAVWHSTYLYREIEGTIYRVPMTQERCGVRNAPDDEHFTITSVDAQTGAETVDIHPGYVNQ